MHKEQKHLLSRITMDDLKAKTYMIMYSVVFIFVI